MLAQAVDSAPATSGLRPFHPTRDLAQVADLIELAFKEDLALTGEPLVAELRRMASWGPLLYILLPPGALPSGFVWEESGKIVGNVHVGQALPDGHQWLISNVAVHPDYRRRGIARQLLEAALDYIVFCRGESALLQVRADNEPALKLYHDLRFEPIHTKLEMQHPSAEGLEVTTSPVWRAYRAADRSSVRAILAGMAPDLGQLWPLFYGRYPSGTGYVWLDRLGDVFGRRRAMRLVAPASGQIVAFLEAQAQSQAQAPHRLFLAARLGAPQEWLTALLRQGLALLAGVAPRPAHLALPDSAEHEVDAAIACGFREVRRLVVMRRDLRPFNVT